MIFFCWLEVGSHSAEMSLKFSLIYVELDFRADLHLIIQYDIL